MVKLRFQRLGRSHRPFYRLVAVDARFKRTGRFIEQLGWHNPMAADGEKDLELNEDRIRYWIGVGAQPSDTVTTILAQRDLLSAKQKTRWERLRGEARRRGEARSAVKRAEAAQEALATLESDAVADLGQFLKDIAPHVESAKGFAGRAKPEDATASAEQAEAVLAAAQKAEDDAKKKQAEEEAAAKAAEEAAAAEAESTEEASEEAAAE